jgi:pimeloyl-ACP methyl ester carboxylesterase
MADVVVFVHGTGVREQSWAKSFTVVRRRLLDLDSVISVHGCFWGGSEGAELKDGGASIPAYAETRPRGDPSQADEDLALWVVLYTDPWYEIRLLGNWPSDRGEIAPGSVPTSVRFNEQIGKFVPSEGLGRLLASFDLRPHFDDACASLRATPEFERAVDAATEENLNELRKAVARALVAATMIGAEDAGEPPVDGVTRDVLVRTVIDDLHGYGMGIATWLVRPVKGVALHLVTLQISRRRAALSDATSPAAGDIVRYQARGSGIRRYIRQVVADAVAEDPVRQVTLLAHSLGGIACVDALIEEPIPGVKRLVTVGSQAPFFYEIDALAALRHGQPLPDWFPPWLNIYDTCDFLSYIAAGIFPGRVTDQRVDNGQPFPTAHSAYWRNDMVWQHIGGFLA